MFIQDNLDIKNAYSALLLVNFAGIAAGYSAKSLPDLKILDLKARKLFEIFDLEDE
jgi:hypothetical protein